MNISEHHYLSYLLTIVDTGIADDSRGERLFQYVNGLGRVNILSSRPHHETKQVP